MVNEAVDIELSLYPLLKAFAFRVTLLMSVMAPVYSVED